MKPLILTILSVLGCFSVLYGDKLPDTVQLAQVEVKAKSMRLDESIRKMEFDSLSMITFSTQGLAELLQMNSPVFIKENGFGGLSTASFRGTAANHTLVLWNGVSINGPQLGQVDFSVIPVFFMDKVSLIAGISGIQQSAGIGGVVAVDNKADFGRKLEAEALQTGGSFNSFGSYFSVKSGSDKFVAQTRLFRRSSSNEFSYINTAAWPNSEMKLKDASYYDQGFQQEFHYRGEHSTVGFVSWNQWNEHNLPPIMTNIGRGGDPKEKQKDAFSRNVLTWKLYKGPVKLSFRTSYFAENQSYYLRTTSAYEPYEIVTQISSHNSFQAWNNNLSIQYQDDRYSLEAALDLGLEKVSTDNYLKAQKRKKAGLSIGGQYNFSDELMLKGQVRIESVNKNTGDLQPFIELAYVPLFMKGLSLGVSGGKVLRFPTMNDLYWYPGGNPDLVPERSLQTMVNVGYEITSDRIVSKSKTSLFVSDIKDWIQWRPTTFMYWVPENVARVIARGFEFHQQCAYKNGELTISVSGNYAFTMTTDESPVAKIDQYSGRQLIYIPRHHGNMMGRIDYKKAFVGLGAEFVGERRVSYNNEDQLFDYLPAYQLFHVSTGYRFRDFETVFKVNNLFGERYQSVLWRPMPGRYYEVAVSYKISKKKE